MSDLRNHSQPCEHAKSAWIPGTLLLGRFGRSDLWQCDELGCPGGREVTIDYEAAVTAYVEGSSWTTTAGMDAAIHRAVDAAIGDTG